MTDKLRYFIYRQKYRHAKNLPLRTPVDVSLELSSFCTNQCGYCYHSDVKTLPFKRGRMPVELAEKLIAEMSIIGVNSIKFNYRGEATMNQHFSRIAKFAKLCAHGSSLIDRILNSNFNFKLDNEDIFQGLMAMTKVKVSFDSFRKDIFEKQRQGSNFEATLRNMEKFYSYPRRDNEFVVQAVRTRLNANEDLEGEIRKRFPSATASIRDVVKGRTEKDISNITIRKVHDKRQSCIQAHARMIVNWDGKVQACCPDIKSQIILGDANVMSLKNIWNSEAAKELRFQLKTKEAFKKNPCKTCSSYESYAGYKHPWSS